MVRFLTLSVRHLLLGAGVLLFLGERVFPHCLLRNHDVIWTINKAIQVYWLSTD